MSEQFTACDCGWKMPAIEMRCRLRVAGPAEESDKIKAAAESVEELLETGGTLDILGTIKITCPQCGERYSQQGKVARDIGLGDTVLQ